MARQSTTPVSFQKSSRPDTAVLMSSGRAGVVQPVCYIPLLAGDSASGKVGIDIQLKEMPKPLLNGVFANFQAWFVPKSAHPQFPGRDELLHARTGQVIKSLGMADRTPPAFFQPLGVAGWGSLDIFKRLGMHFETGTNINSDLLDAFSVIYNFRLAAHSSRLARRQYTAEGISAGACPPAFWPSSRFSRIVPDYERALVVGSLDLDVIAGQLPVSGIGFGGVPQAPALGTAIRGVNAAADFASDAIDAVTNLTGGNPGVVIRGTGASLAAMRPQVFAEMAGTRVSVTLADIDSARKTQAFAKLRASYAGNDTTGFDNDDTLVAHLMQGISVQPDDFRRPWLLDSARVAVGFAERHASDGANLAQSVTLGRASCTLRLNVPNQDVSGLIIVTVEVLPERIDERQSDEFMQITAVSGLPNALRDAQRIEPVDLVLNRRIDAKHATPGGVYGHEPMNDKWSRDFTRLGGDFYMATPGGGWTQNRSAIWQHEIVNPIFGTSHFLAPAPFPHDVFADQNADAFEVVCRHAVSIVGLTQMGDALVENSDDYGVVENTL